MYATQTTSPPILQMGKLNAGRSKLTHSDGRATVLSQCSLLYSYFFFLPPPPFVFILLYKPL